MFSKRLFEPDVITVYALPAGGGEGGGGHWNAPPGQPPVLTLHLDVSQGVAQTVVLRRSALPTAGADALLPGLLPSL